MKLFTISQPFGTANRPSAKVFLFSRGRALYPHVGLRGLFPFSRVFFPLELYHSRNVSAIVTRSFQHVCEVEVNFSLHNFQIFKFSEKTLDFRFPAVV